MDYIYGDVGIKVKLLKGSTLSDVEIYRISFKPPEYVTVVKMTTFVNERFSSYHFDSFKKENLRGISWYIKREYEFDKENKTLCLGKRKNV